MTRYSAIQKIMWAVTDEVVITSTGMISREVYQIKDRDRNFYMQGSMGMALPIGIGLAYSRPDLKVIVISGDSAVLMNMGSLVLHKWLVGFKGMNNLTHYILDNTANATTGGQPTCSNVVDFCLVAPTEYTRHIRVSLEKGDSPRILLSCKEIKERVYNSIKRSEA
jgi:thiamine pyrophosphate-dependent acetolactate synthase large subunit-like protein